MRGALSLAVLGAYVCGGAACATLGGVHQRVKLASEPAPALVYDEDGEELGTSNQFADLWRSYSEDITYERNGERHTVEVESSYRWGESFASNLAWLVAGPFGPLVGWSVDLLSGAAWTYDPLPVAQFTDGGAAVAETDLAPPHILIAPPEHELGPLSDEVARHLYNQARERWPNAQLVSLDDAAPLLMEYGWSHEERTPDAFIERVYDELGVTHVVEAAVAEGDATLGVDAMLYNVFTEKADAFWHLDLPRGDLHTARLGSFGRLLLSTVTWIPNTLTFDITTPTSAIAATAPGADGRTGYAGKEVFDRNLLTFLSGAGMRTLRSSRVRGNFDPVAGVSPSVGVAWHQVEFRGDRDAGAPAPAAFDWLWATVGVTAEIGLETLFGYFYASITPQWGPHVIAGGLRDGPQVTRWRFPIQLEAEGGYLFFLTRNFNIRIFGRAGSPPGRLWEDTFTALGEDGVRVGDVETRMVGISFGYFFPEIAALGRRWVLD